MNFQRWKMFCNHALFRSKILDIQIAHVDIRKCWAEQWIFRQAFYKLTWIHPGNPQVPFLYLRSKWHTCICHQDDDMVDQFPWKIESLKHSELMQMLKSCTHNFYETLLRTVKAYETFVYFGQVIFQSEVG